MKKALHFVVLLCLCLCATKAYGQATTSLRGTVTDPAGSVIVGAQVTIANSSTGFTRSVSTASDGTYVFVEVPPGSYTLTVEMKGFQKHERLGMELRVDLPATVNVQLRVGTVAEVVSITAEAPTLNTTDASIGHTMGNNEIAELPIQAENMPLLLSFQPGVVYNGTNLLTDYYDTRAGAVNGERSDQNNINLDGVSINDEFNGFAFTGVLPTTQFSVEEFRVTTSNYGASEGRSAGAQINMVTKGGTNNFHGEAYEFNRNTVGEANEYFLKASQLENGQANVPQKLVRNVFGGAVGGPIIKDRLFFFANYEGHRIAQGSSQVRVIPSATLRQGIIQYLCQETTPGQLNTSACPGGSVLGADGNSYTFAPGYNALGPAQLQQMDPLGIGVSQVALKYLQSYPMPNDLSQGDGYNYAGYRFSAPTPTKNDWVIFRLDYKIDHTGNHMLFLRGSGRDDSSVTGAQFLPGTQPESSAVDLSRGLVGGYTGVYGSHWVNNIRYGYTHQSVGSIGDSDQPWVYFRGMDQGVTYSSQFTAPVHNIVDSASWIKGTHTFEFGGNILLMRNNGSNYGSSFSDALLNSDWLTSGGFAQKASPLNPACNTQNPSTACSSYDNYPAVDSSFTNSYDFPLAGIMGIASEVDAQYNYKVVNTTTASPIAQGDPIRRRWAVDTYNLFFQDTWRARRDLSITYGLNYQLMTPMTEKDGQEVTPSVNMGAWFQERANGMLKGIPASADSLISFSPSGSYYGRSGLYSTQTKNFAPRLGVAWTPHSNNGLLSALFGNGKTVIRAGAGMYYDNFGPELATQYDAGGSFGLSSTLSNPSATLTLNQAPRITAMSGPNAIPASITPAAPPSTFPVEFPATDFAIARGIDQSLKTPYSYAFDLSIQRELPGRMTLDVAYVGHMSHRLLVYDDVAAPLDLFDPKTGIDWNAAAKRMSQLQRANTPQSSINASTVGPTAQYWTDMFVAQPSYGLCVSPPNSPTTTTSMLQSIYNLFSLGCGNLYNETSASFLMDLYGFPVSPVGGSYSYYNPQYSSLWDWRSIGHSNYNALQVGLHRQMYKGALFGFNYTYSRTMDIESTAERGAHYLTDSVINPFDINQMYAPADYDLRHQINGYWLVELPFGHGKPIAGHAQSWVDAIIGGWQLGGTTRWTSGFPVSVFMGYVWPTNWDEMGWADFTGQPIGAGTSTSTGVPNIFKNPTQAANAFTYAYPGESGQRNTVRGDGFLTTDMNLQKSWRIPHTETHALQLRWSLFNAFNNVRFDAFSMQDEVSGGNFGNYSSTLTNPREMEFALIYKF